MTAALLSIDASPGSSPSLATELPVLLRRHLARWSTTAAAVLAAGDAGAGEEPRAASVDPTDSADIQGSLGGDGEAYARLVRRYQQAIGHYMWRFTRNPGDWEELVHDVFVEAYLSLSGYQARSPLLHWLKRIATRVGYRHWKRRKRQRDHTDQLNDQTAATLAAPGIDQGAREAGELVHQLLSRLSPRDRMVMTLMYLESCTTAEIAELTGWSQTMVKVQAHRARKRLQKIWEAARQEP